LQPDAAGAFSHAVAVRGEYRVVADTGDGHRAEWRVAASEFGGESPAGAERAAGAGRAAAAEGAARAEGASTKGAGATGASAKEAASAEGSASSESAALNADRADASLPRAARDRVQPAIGEVETLVERAVARQIRPLREALEAERSRARLHDILGGLGYIAGLAGLALWWRSRKGVSAP
jgi:nickel transport protein